LLQSELKKIQELASLLHPENGGGNDPAQDLETLKKAIEKECGQVCEALTKAVFTQPRENLLERYIQFHQTGIIDLADQLQPCIPEDKDPLRQITTGFFISRLFELLTYIERYFSKYFNPEARIPESYRLIAVKQLGEPIGTVIDLIENNVRSQALKSCLLDYLHYFDDAKFPGNLTFNNLIYLKSFLAETVQVFQLKEVKDWDIKLSAALVYLNFNHLGFLTYCQDVIRAELDNADSKEQYLFILSRALGHIKSLQSKPIVSYNSSWPNIKPMLETWLNDEIAIAVIQPARSQSPETSEKSGPAEKMVLNLSVAQIACFTRLFYEENCFAPVSVTDIFKFTVRHYRSKRQEQISTGSLSKEYYSISQVTAAVVRDLLQKMIARINKQYFPAWVAISAASFGWSLIS
jgi:hypothetical protein